MRPFAYQRATDASAAVRVLAAAVVDNAPLTEAAIQPLAGGTTLIDLMKLDVMRPSAVVDINSLSPGWSAINLEGGNLRLGALAGCRMSPPMARYRTAIPLSPMRSSSPRALSSGIWRRSAATFCSGHVAPISAMSAMTIATSAIRGPAAPRWKVLIAPMRYWEPRRNVIATYPGDFAQSLIALDATVEITGKSGIRSVPFAELHKPPGVSPQIETILVAGELISGFTIHGRWPRSVYLKARDRQSYEFALSSAAIALDLQEGVVRDVRVALGGVATIPWRAREAEALIKGQKLDDALIQRVAEAAFAGATAKKHNAFKIALGKRVVARALHQAAIMEI
jgi:xanthine dehydrogenase YagS FAD-binding subunit